MVGEISSLKMSNGRWMLVECGGERMVVNVRAVVNGDTVRPGDTVMVTSRGSEKKEAALIMTSHDRKFLEHQIKKDQSEAKGDDAAANEEAQPEPQLYEEVGDFSPSGSSWGPEATPETSDSDEMDIEEDQEDTSSKRLKVELVQKQYTNSKKTMTPTLRPEPVVPKHLKDKLKKLKQISISKENGKGNNSHRNVDQSLSQPRKASRAVTVSAEELKKVNRDLSQFKEMLSSLKNAVNSIRMTLSADHLYETVYASGADELKQENKPVEAVDEIRVIKSSDQKDKINVLRPIQAIKPITYGELRQSIKSLNQSRHTVSPVVNNNNNHVSKKQKKEAKADENGSRTSGSVRSDAGSGDMVPIGSGKTLVPRSIYNQINWNSHTMATRKLLMAIFPRRTLATHSLTGKASPAFTNKPAKLSLDPKKVFDIVITVTKKCNVKESLVRGAITTKCADENKMMRIQKEKTRKTMNSTPLGRKPANQDERRTEGLNQTS